MQRDPSLADPSLANGRAVDWTRRILWFAFMAVIVMGLQQVAEVWLLPTMATAVAVKQLEPNVEVADQLRLLESCRGQLPLASAGVLLESELFGHEKGAFTGADESRDGKFSQADGGTLFLDEIAHMSLPFQRKILRVVEYGTYNRVGSWDSSFSSRSASRTEFIPFAQENGMNSVLRVLKVRAHALFCFWRPISYHVCVGHRVCGDDGLPAVRPPGIRGD